jgi:hypothetical protein
LAAAALTLAWGSARADTPPTDNPAIQRADTATRRIEIDEAALEKLSADLKKALDAYAPGPLSLGQEQNVLSAFRERTKKQLEEGKAIADLMERLSRAAAALSESMNQAPGHYREAAKLNRVWAAEAKFKSNKEDYLLVAETWEALAGHAEKRVKELNLDTTADGTLDFLKEQNLFLERFLQTLSALPQAADTPGQYRQLRDKLRKHAAGYYELRRSLKLFREKVGGDALNPDVRERTRAALKAEAEEEVQRQTRAARERRREEALAFASKSGIRLTYVKDDWATLSAPAGTGIQVRQTLTFYRVGDGVEARGRLTVVSYDREFYVVRCLSGSFQVGDFVCPPGASPPGALLTDPRVAPPPDAYPSAYAYRRPGRD